MSEEIWKFSEGEARGKFSNSQRYFQIHDVQGNVFANSREKTEFNAISLYTYIEIFQLNLGIYGFKWEFLTINSHGNFLS